MKSALIIHGTDGLPNDHWQPWFKEQLEFADYQVSVPQFPGSNRPNFAAWSELIRTKVGDLSDGVLVGHSAGTTIILRLLEQDWFSKVKAVVLVGTFLNDRLVKQNPSYDKTQFADLLPENFDINKIKSKCDKFYFVHGDNDPYCDYQDALDFCKQLSGEFITVKNGHHLGSERNLTELPEIIEKMTEDGVLNIFSNLLDDEPVEDQIFDCGD